MSRSTYMRDRLGSASIVPAQAVEAGSHASFELRYTAGYFGIDDTGSLLVVQRFASDMESPQFADPAASGYVSVEASNGATLAVSWDLKGNLRPWDKAIRIKVVRGFLRAGDRITARFGDRRQGSPGIRMQTFCEESFELKVLVDAFATCDYVELPSSPTLRVVAGAPARWKAVLPTLRGCGEPFRLGLLAEDLWGNPTDRVDAEVRLRAAGVAVDLPARVRVSPHDPVAVVEGLVAREEGELVVEAFDSSGKLLARSNPMRVLARPEHRSYWADMHGQSEETIGTNSVRDYYRFGRDRAFLDAICHQGNDFQITAEFWADLQRAADEHDRPGRYAAFAGYEWSGNTGLGGDHNVIFLRAGERIRRSSHALVADLSDAEADCHSSRELYAALAGADAFLYAHVGGRYADLSAVPPGSRWPAVEIHSAWGTFEWLLHDAFALGLRPGVVANSDDHKGRPGASYPGASRFGAYGGLTCFLATKLDREAIFDCLRRRRHYATTGARLDLEVRALSAEGREVVMGEDLRTSRPEIRVRARALCPASVERLELWNGRSRERTVRLYGERDLGRRIRLLWEGAEYRGRGRETVWDGRLEIADNAAEAAREINFWNPEKRLVVEGPRSMCWQSITTGNTSGLELLLEEPRSGSLRIHTPLVRREVAIRDIGLEDLVLEAGGLGRRIRLFRLPDRPASPAIDCEETLDLRAGADNPVYARLVLEDGHVAWSSPIYLTLDA